MRTQIQIIFCLVVIILGRTGFSGEAELLLCGFESKAEIGKLQLDNVEIELSAEHVTQGKNGAKLTYYGNPMKESYPCFRMVLTQRDWGGYDFIAMDVYNPQDQGVKVRFCFQDLQGGWYYAIPYCTEGGKGYHADINTYPDKGKSKKTVKIPVSEIAGEVDLKKMHRLSYYADKPKTDIVLFVDNLRLIRERQ